MVASAVVLLLLSLTLLRLGSAARRKEPGAAAGGRCHGQGGGQVKPLTWSASWVNSRDYLSYGV